MRLLALLLTAGAGLTQAARVVYDWNITYVTANPDNLYERQVVGVNGKWPLPAIHVNLGDTLVINAHNALDIPTSLHSHGMFQNNTPWMDGPVGVTQCAIPPNYNLTYEFNITQHGSYWIHSHYMGQYMDGLRGPLILHNPNETYTYDEEVIVTVSDWYHKQSSDNLNTFLNVANPTGAEPVPQSGIINDSANTTFSFTPGKTYRLRFINISGFSTFYLSIDNHTLDIIEVDGVSQNTHTHLITIVSNHQNFASSQDVGMQSTFDDFILVPLINATIPEPDQSVNLTFNFDVTTDGFNRGMFNELPYLQPKVPSLNTMLGMGNDSNNVDVYGPQSMAYIMKHLDFIEVAISNFDSGNHPFHLHGHTFYMAGRGNGTWTGDRSSTEWSSNPMSRDTILIPAEQYVIIRFRADNPGPWFFHCHIDWHLESGLAATFIVAPDVAQQRMTLPQAFKDVCIAGGNPSEGNAAGKEGLDLSGAPSGITLLYDGFTAKGKGAMAACIICALIGIASIIFYALSDPEKKAREIANAKLQNGSISS
ncbi:Cupredoxin [Absidia repens]|uniref:Cupredoxin n=1 Tax=Absidia repens TaxID=90262 RepID=A0A1X2ICW2_9FUNG|nr:Cupredoxin [Absidia repens]